MKTKKNILISFAALLLLSTFFVMGAIFTLPQAEAAPPAEITPVVNPAYPSGSSFVVNGITAGTVITSDTAGTWFKLGDAGIVEPHVILDMGTATNTITVSLRHSNNVSMTPIDGEAFSSVATSTVMGDQFINHFDRTQLYFDVSGTDPVTITFAGLHVRR